MNSKKATKFRQWATKTLRDYITKGFVLNEKLLKNGKQFGKDYFDELLEKSAKFARVKGVHIRESRIFLSSAAAITTKTAKQQRIFMPSCRTSFILR